MYAVDATVKTHGHKIQPLIRFKTTGRIEINIKKNFGYKTYIL